MVFEQGPGKHDMIFFDEYVKEYVNEICVHRRHKVMRLEKIFHEFIEYSEREKLYIEGIAIADEVQVLMEHHFTPDLQRNIYSHTKSYMATAAGIAIEEGKLSLDARLVDFFQSICQNRQIPVCLR